VKLEAYARLCGEGQENPLMGPFFTLSEQISYHTSWKSMVAIAIWCKDGKKSQYERTFISLRLPVELMAAPGPRRLCLLWVNMRWLQILRRPLMGAYQALHGQILAFALVHAVAEIKHVR
jgi:hypothetical protein